MFFIKSLRKDILLLNESSGLHNPRYGTLLWYENEPARCKDTHGLLSSQRSLFKDCNTLNISRDTMHVHVVLWSTPMVPAQLSVPLQQVEE